MEENLLMLSLKRIPSGNVCMLAAVPQCQRHHWFFVNASMTDSFCSLFSALHVESAGSVEQALGTECPVSHRLFNTYRRLQK